MKLGLLVVLAVVALVPCLSEGRTVTPCELVKKLGPVLGPRIWVPQRYHNRRYQAIFEQRYRNRILVRVYSGVLLASRLNTGRVRVFCKRRTTTLSPTTIRPNTTEAMTPTQTTMRPVTTRPSTMRPTTTRPSTMRPVTTGPSTMRPTTTRPSTTRPTTTGPSTVKLMTTTRSVTTKQTTTDMPTSSSTSGSMTTSLTSNQMTSVTPRMRRKREAGKTGEEVDDLVIGVADDEQENSKEDNDKKNDEGEGNDEQEQVDEQEEDGDEIESEELAVDEEGEEDDGTDEDDWEEEDKEDDGDEDNEEDAGGQEVSEEGKRKKRSARSYGRRRHHRRYQRRRHRRPRTCGLYGLFQMRDSYQCNSGYVWSKNVCQKSCNAFTDNDIMDDIKCFVESGHWRKLYRLGRRIPYYRAIRFFRCR